MNQKIRISNEDLIVIENIFKRYFTNFDHLWLFGSRADLNKKGGDIDFYIETIETDLKAAAQKVSYFIITLQELLGDQKIDVVLNVLSTKQTLPIYSIAKQTGVQLL